VFISRVTSVISGPNVHQMFLSNVGWVYRTLSAERGTIIAVDTLVLRFWIFPSVPEIFAIEVWSCSKSALILHVFGPTFLGGRLPTFWDLDYKTEQTSRHVAKFHVDRPIELGDHSVKKDKKETSAVKHTTAGNYRTSYILCAYLDERLAAFQIHAIPCVILINFSWLIRTNNVKTVKISQSFYVYLFPALCCVIG